MTNLEVLSAMCLYPVKQNTLLLALTNHDLVSTDTYYVTDAVQVKNMELAAADVLTLLVTAPNSVSEGGYSISKPDIQELKNLAAGYYAKYGEESPAIKRPSVRAKHPW